MGKSNNSYNECKKFYVREKNLNNFLEEECIKKLESINKIFIKRIIANFSKFIKYNIQLSSYNMRIESNNIRKKLIHVNLIKILPFNDQSLIIFSSNFFSVIIEILFGGNHKFSEENRKKISMTSTEKFINKKITEFITESYSDAYKEFFAVNFINIKVFISFKESYFKSNEVFLTNHFNFHINNVEVFFSVFIPLFLIKKINKKINILDNKNQITKKNISNSISLNDINNVELDIAVRLMNFSMSYSKFYELSVGDVLSIEKPNEIITAYLEGKPVFFSNYKIFNNRFVIFIEKFIKDDLNSDKNKEGSNE